MSHHKHNRHYHHHHHHKKHRNFSPIPCKCRRYDLAYEGMCHKKIYP